MCFKVCKSDPKISGSIKQSCPKRQNNKKKYNYLFCHNKKFFSFGNRSILHHQLKASLQGIDFQLLETGINLCISIKMLTLNGMKI